jgi:hypothetical protein
LNYLLASHVWQQDHNGFTHQDPGFIDHVINKKADIVRVYLPPDANCLLSVFDHCLRSRHYVNPGAVRRNGLGPPERHECPVQVRLPWAVAFSYARAIQQPASGAATRPTCRQRKGRSVTEPPAIARAAAANTPPRWRMPEHRSPYPHTRNRRP